VLGSIGFYLDIDQEDQQNSDSLMRIKNPQDTKNDVAMLTVLSLVVKMLLLKPSGSL